MSSMAVVHPHCTVLIQLSDYVNDVSHCVDPFCRVQSSTVGGREWVLSAARASLWLLKRRRGGHQCGEAPALMACTPSHSSRSVNQ